jgi:hypothetical protein
MEHPWLLLGSVAAGGPLIWTTFRLLFPDLSSDLEEDGAWLVVGAVTGWWTATVTLLKGLVLLAASAAYVAAAYNLWTREIVS